MAIDTSSVAGIISGRNPIAYESSNPITIFLFQSILIISLCYLIHIPLKFLKQPKVIAEVLTGIILGPTVLGNIPNFSSNVFPSDSIPGLTLVANFGLILFLFLIGLEIDLNFIKNNLKIALTVGIINMAIPFGFGCIISIGLYNEYHTSQNDNETDFSTYLVFIAVAMCITAFPVLARILSELNLITDKIGVIVLAAGITNDIFGWVLLALSITLANADNAITTVYILLVAFGWMLFILFPVKYLIRWAFIKKTNEINNGPSTYAISIMIVLVYISSFFTDIIGVHPIFGAFLVGLIIPRDNNYVEKLIVKIDDLTQTAIIPLYFTLAGLKTDLTSLNSAKDWGYIVAIIAIAMITKILGGFLGSILFRLSKRESLTVGVLMSCKGIVEIVVLTTGLNAGIISEKVFSMFIVMALICTFLTTPLTLWVYPTSHREKIQPHIT
ncbi:Sodium/hydrogen exchanger [Ascoidea rubescens DSM 1968]|uniref:Sodium/hydrogen exchanger n=1 Tax=Ascoidea rubescens DSM 1968 TaxID=1344418 RepID=A0A1D2VEU7_9ASCO|nr:Sodium/hydrogen exchanger [Ascoidea rubescens DSM 1968]ODV60156.1 Sodium/hydrogen exchanger [Ascoidea rubescens DSM 1968]